MNHIGPSLLALTVTALAAAVIAAMALHSRPTVPPLDGGWCPPGYSPALNMQHTSPQPVCERNWP